MTVKSMAKYASDLQMTVASSVKYGLYTPGRIRTSHRALEEEYTIGVVGGVSSAAVAAGSKMVVRCGGVLTDVSAAVTLGLASRVIVVSTPAARQSDQVVRQRARVNPCWPTFINGDDGDGSHQACCVLRRRKCSQGRRDDISTCRNILDAVSSRWKQSSSNSKAITRPSQDPQARTVCVSFPVAPPRLHIAGGQEALVSLRSTQSKGSLLRRALRRPPPQTQLGRTPERADSAGSDVYASLEGSK